MFNLLTDAWIPVVTHASAHRTISFRELSSGDVADIAWNRADFWVATHELLIGLLAVMAAPQESGDWHDLFEVPPSEADLAKWSAPLVRCFNLDGDGPRFLQDFESLEGDSIAPSALLIDAPGANTRRKNADLFIRHVADETYSRAGAMMALYTLQAFAPSGGAGHRTSMRGGGPMTTLVDPQPASGRASLWQSLWAHVPILTGTEMFPQNEAEWPTVFPWLAPTATSEKGQTVEEKQVHGLQAYFGMPRRIRLVFASNDAKRVCPLTGQTDDRVVTGYTTRPWGINYGVWRHPLTPYYRPKAGGHELPVHPRGGLVSYRDWIGLSLSSPQGDRNVAEAVRNFQERRPDGLRSADLIVAGYAMNNASVKEFIEARIPLFRVASGEDQKTLDRFARQLVAGAEWMASRLAKALADARKTEKSESVVTSFADAFWQDTQQAFHDHLTEAVSRLSGTEEQRSSEDDFGQDMRQSWRDHLIASALRLFDRAVPPEKLLLMRDGEARDYTAARWSIVRLRSEKKLHEELSLPLPPKPSQPASGRAA